MHVNTYLYKHIHSHHHRLTVPYAYGALYNHPLEALLLDTLGGVITLYASGMRCEDQCWEVGPACGGLWHNCHSGPFIFHGPFALFCLPC